MCEYKLFSSLDVNKVSVFFPRIFFPGDNSRCLVLCNIHRESRSFTISHSEQSVTQRYCLIFIPPPRALSLKCTLSCDVHLHSCDKTMTTTTTTRLPSKVTRREPKRERDREREREKKRETHPALLSEIGAHRPAIPRRSADGDVATGDAVGHGTFPS